MTLEEAISIKNNDPPMPHPLDRGKIDEADLLSIEALEAIKQARCGNLRPVLFKLPSETEKE